MTNLTRTENINQRNLAQVYVSLALARAAAEEYAARQPADPLLRAVLNTMGLMAELLEETMQGTGVAGDVHDSLPVASSELSM